MKRFVLTKRAMLAITAITCSLAVVFSTVAFIDIADTHGLDMGDAVWTSAVIASFFLSLWLWFAWSLFRS